MRAQVRLALRLGRFDGTQIGLERHLGVEQHRLAARQPHRHVGPEDSVCDLDDGLLVEIDVRAQSRQLQRAAELGLSPSPALGRSAQRRGESRRLASQLLLGHCQRPHLLREARRRHVGGFLQLLDLLVDAAERLVHRPDQLRHCLRALFQLGTRRLLCPPQHLLRQLHQVRAIRVERLLRQRGERLLQLVLLLLRSAQLGLQRGPPRLRLRQRGLQDRELLRLFVASRLEQAQAGARRSEQVEDDGDSGGERGAESSHAVRPPVQRFGPKNASALPVRDLVRSGACGASTRGELAPPRTPQTLVSRFR